MATSYYFVGSGSQTWSWNTPQNNWATQSNGTPIPTATIIAATYNNPSVNTGGSITNAVSNYIATSQAITSATTDGSGNTTYKMATNPFVTGQFIFVEGMSDNSYNGLQVVVSTTSNSFTSSNVYATPSTAYGGYAFLAKTSGLSRASASGLNITFTTANSLPNVFSVGDYVETSGFDTTPADVFNNSWTVVSTTSNSFTVATTSTPAVSVATDGYASIYPSVTYTCPNNFQVGQLANVTGVFSALNTGGFNVSNAYITAASSSSFTVLVSNPYNGGVLDFYSSGGTPTITSTIGYTATNSFSVGQTALVSSISPSDYNLQSQVVYADTSSFQVIPIVAPTDTYVSGGVANVFPVSGDSVVIDSHSGSQVTTSGNVSVGSLSISSGGRVSLGGTLTGSLSCNGTFTTNNYACSLPNASFSGSTLSFGTSAITITSGPIISGDTSPSWSLSGNNKITYSNGCSITFNNSLGFGSVFYIASLGTNSTHPPITYNGTGPFYFLSAIGSASFPLSSLTHAPTISTTTSGNLIVSAGSTLSVANTLTIAAALGQVVNSVGQVPIYFASDASPIFATPTTWSYTPATISAGSVAITYTTFQNITATGAASWSTPDSSGWGDGGGNTGITFSTSRNCYYKNPSGTAANWSTQNWYSQTNAGGSRTRNPLPQDVAIFDANSSASNATVTVDPTIIGGWDASAFLGTLKFTTATTYYLLGSISLGSKTSGSSTTYVIGPNASLNGNLVIRSNNHTLSLSLNVSVSPSAKVSLYDGLSTTNTTITKGTFDATSTNVSSLSFRNFVVASGAVVAMGGTSPSSTQSWIFSGVWTCNGTISTCGYTTLYPTSTTSNTFTGGGQHYFNLTMPVFTTSVATATLTVLGNNTFNNFVCAQSPAQFNNIFSAANGVNQTTIFSGSNTFNTLSATPYSVVTFNDGTTQTATQLLLNGQKNYGQYYDGTANTSQTAANYPQSQVVGDIDVRAYFSTSSWPPNISSNSALVSCLSSTSGWEFGISTASALYFSYSNAPSATITNVVGNGTTATYYANNSFFSGQSVTISGVVPTAYNGSSTIVNATSTYFTVSTTATATFTQRGTATPAIITASASVPTTPTTPYWWRATRVASTGVVSFYLAQDQGGTSSSGGPTSWGTPFATATTPTNNATMNVSATPTINIGAYFSGTFYRAQVYNGINGDPMGVSSYAAPTSALLKSISTTFGNGTIATNISVPAVSDGTNITYYVASTTATTFFSGSDYFGTFAVPTTPTGSKYYNSNSSYNITIPTTVVSTSAPISGAVGITITPQTPPPSVTITAASYATPYTTFTTSGSVPFAGGTNGQDGQLITISGASNANYNGLWIVNTTSTNSFTAQPYVGDVNPGLFMGTALAIASPALASGNPRVYQNLLYFPPYPGQSTSPTTNVGPILDVNFISASFGQGVIYDSSSYGNGNATGAYLYSNNPAYDGHITINSSISGAAKIVSKSISALNYAVITGVSVSTTSAPVYALNSVVPTNGNFLPTNFSYILF